MLKLRLRLSILPQLLVCVIVAIASAGCGGHSEKVLGAPPEASPTATVKEISSVGAHKSVTLRGEMTEKCPVAGCWFMLKDKTGIVRVDTKSSGFVVSDVPLHSTLTVTGAVTAGSSPGLAATGVRY